MHWANKNTPIICKGSVLRRVEEEE